MAEKEKVGKFTSLGVSSPGDPIFKEGSFIMLRPNSSTPSATPRDEKIDESEERAGLSGSSEGTSEGVEG